MKIKTKYKLDDSVYVVSENRICVLSIERININVRIFLGKPYIEIKYFGECGSFLENECYETKDDIIKSL